MDKAFPYSDLVMDHFANPRNMGEIENPSAVGDVGNPTCGDMMRLYLKIETALLLTPNLRHLDAAPR